MFEFIARHRTGLTFVLIVLVLLSAIAAQVPAPDHPSLLAWGLYAVVSPIQQVIAYAIVGAGHLFDEYVNLRDVQRENEALKDELSILYQDNQRLRETLALVGGETELKAFQQLYEETYKYESVDAMVIGAGTGEFDQTVILNKGSLSGVAINQGVISPTGVVGKVVRVGPTSCLVQLITDPNFSMASRLQKSRVNGIVQGTGDNNFCDLLYIRSTDAIELNDRVVSSGLEQIFPQGILIGHVTSISPGEPPLRRVEISPSTKLRSLEWVLIVRWNEEINDQN